MERLAVVIGEHVPLGRDDRQSSDMLGLSGGVVAEDGDRRGVKLDHTATVLR